MNMRFAGLVSATVLACAAAAAPASATAITWDFFTLSGAPVTAPGTDLGSNVHVFTQGPQSVYAQSGINTGGSTWVPAATSVHLYAKYIGAPNNLTNDERGLGLSGDPYSTGEIYNPYGIYLDLRGTTYGHATDVTIGSVQGTSTSGESWAVWGSNNGIAWVNLGSGSGGTMVNFNASSLASYDQLIIADPSATRVNGSNDIVLMSVTTADVPEPATLGLLGLGLAGLGLGLGRRRKA